MSIRYLRSLVTMSLLLGLPLFLTGCKEHKPSTQRENVIRVSTAEDPQTLDPRLARTLVNITFIKMFYEGLMTHGNEGELLPALAEDVEITNHGKRYIFHLKESQWSNGDPVTAQDFALSWKSILEPDFPAPMAHQLYVIQGAKEAKEGKIALDEVGITAQDDKTLVVDLVEPTPFFLEMTTLCPFCPINQKWMPDPTQPLIVSGPFQLQSWIKNSELRVVKNRAYREADQVKVDAIIAMVLDDNTALRMFEAGELDWTGSPLSTIPTDAKASLKANNTLQITPAAGTHWFCFNTEKAPFNHIKLRKALSLAINRQQIVEHIVQGNQIPATGVVPLSYGLQTLPYFEDNNAKMAKALLEEALSEMQLTKEQLHSAVLSYMSQEINHKIAQAVQQQWKDVLGIEIGLCAYEAKAFLEKASHNEFDITIGSFYADFRDPVNFLEIFKSKHNYMNASLWENSEFTQLLNLATRVSHKQNRLNILRRAEKILLSEMPVAPLYYNSYNYIKNDKISGIYFSDLGFLDFKYARLNS